jgi:hypothetical protein
MRRSKGSAMTTSMRLDPVEGFFEIRYEGAVSYPERCSVVDEVEQRLRGSRTRKLLVDYSRAWPSPGTPSALGKFVDRLAHADFARGSAIAFVNGPPEHCAAVEDVSDRVGFVSGRFYHREDAVAWLRLSGAVASRRGPRSTG